MTLTADFGGGAFNLEFMFKFTFDRGLEGRENASAIRKMEKRGGKQQETYL